MLKPARAVADCNNRKLSVDDEVVVSTTYVGRESCDFACPYYGNKACYGDAGTLYPIVIRRDAAAYGMTPLELAEAEAAEIDTLPATDGLRLHTIGDSKTPDAARTVADASERYMERGGGPTWTYTHSWRDVPRIAWGRVSVLASVETIADGHRARAAGYALAYTVEKHASKKAYLDANGTRRTPCPQQTGAALDCMGCGLCFNDIALLERNAAIDFEGHGNTNIFMAALRAAKRE